MKHLIKHISYSLFSNFISMLVSVVMVLIIPKFISVEDYGLWQLFLFYCSYLGFLHFGWLDGVYLRYAGVKYEKINKSILLGQVVCILSAQMILGLILFVVFYIFDSWFIDSTVYFCLVFAMILLNGTTLFNYIFRMTSRINDYARMTALGPLIFLFLVGVTFFMGERNTSALICCKLISLFVIFIISSYTLRDLIKEKIPSLEINVDESKKNIKVGLRLMLTSIANMLVIGVVRFGISRGWDVATFGKVSLALSVSNFLLVFINAVSIVLLPTLCNINEEKRRWVYHSGRLLLTAGMLVILLIYFPIYRVLFLWIPQYSESLEYMAILFPICLAESRMSLLINTYLMAIRKEKMLFSISWVSVLFSLVVTFICVAVIHDLFVCICSITIIYVFKVYWGEWNLFRLWGGNIWHNFIVELSMIIIFILAAFLNNWCGMVIYSIALLLYLFLYRGKIIRAFHSLK